MENMFEDLKRIDFPTEIPTRLGRVTQAFDTPQVGDLVGTTREALENGGILGQKNSGDSVAVGVGSRGIANLPIVVKATLERLQDAGMKPFMVPAMGSHGGATADGQRGMLAELGVTEESMGFELRSSMEVVEIGKLDDGPPLYQCKHAAGADHSVLVSRVKPHTDFRSNLESGPSKMCVIGWGKQYGASLMHSGGAPNFRKYLAPAARVYETNTNFRGAVCLLENAYDDTAEIVGLTDDEVGGPHEVALLERAKSYMASIPFPEVDVLVIREMGKNISGTGMDTNILGRLMIPREDESAFGGPDVAIIVTLDVTDESHGNVSGLGLANITTQRLVEKINWYDTYMNAITSGSFSMWRMHLPLTMADDRRAFQMGVRGCARTLETTRSVFIRDTLTLDEMWVTPNMFDSVNEHPMLTLEEEVPLSFDERGNMMSPWEFS